MLTVTCFDGKGGKALVEVPRRYATLVARYGVYDKDRGWLSIIEFQSWIQLPGAVRY